ncbi:DUF1380 family protein [Erwinia amylovora]
MHGNVNDICARLLDQFDPSTPLSILIWTTDDIHDCTSDMCLSHQEAESVLAEISECHSHHQYGVGRDTIWSLAKQLREDAARERKITISAGPLQEVLKLAAEFLRLEDIQGGEGAAKRLYADESEAVRSVRETLEKLTRPDAVIAPHRMQEPSK